MSDEKEISKIEQKTISFNLLAISVFAVEDIYIDLYDGGSWSHMTMKIGMVLVGRSELAVFFLEDLL